jgi:hypothetical protein
MLVRGSSSASALRLIVLSGAKRDTPDREISPHYYRHASDFPSHGPEWRDGMVSIVTAVQGVCLTAISFSGKSTQLPAYILENHLSRGYPVRIFCTEPRRISALSLAQRVSRELGDAPGAVGSSNSLVGYSIRLESKISRNTMLAYVTNGIALRMFESGGDGSGGGFDDVTVRTIPIAVADYSHPGSISSSTKCVPQPLTADITAEVGI